jgi:hypothetical protein
MYYLGTVIFNMTEDAFWRCTPRKYVAVMIAHMRFYNTNKEDDPKSAIEAFASW